MLVKDVFLRADRSGMVEIEEESPSLAQGAVALIVLNAVDRLFEVGDEHKNCISAKSRSTELWVLLPTINPLATPLPCLQVHPER